MELKKREKNSPLLVSVSLFVLDTGTAVTFFFTRDMDLLAVARRQLGGGSERRVLTLPSGLLLVGEVDVNLFVGRGDLGVLGFPVGGGEDAEGNGDAGLKVQDDDFWRERIFSYNLPEPTATKGR